MILSRFHCFVLMLISYVSIQDITHAHGFARNTLIKADHSGWYTIEQTAYLSKNLKKQCVASYDVATGQWVTKRVMRGAYAHTNCYCKISFDDDCSHDIICSPTQLFYSVTDEQWVPACNLKINDCLLASDVDEVLVVNVIVVDSDLKLYTLQVEDTHTFLVGTYSIVAHNMVVSIAAVIGLSIPFGAECGGTAGAFFGPPGIVGGIVIGGIVGCIVQTCRTNQVREYKLTFDTSKLHEHVLQNKNKSEDTNNGAQAPGMPTEKDGYYPPKKWDGKKVKNQNGHSGWGWPDKHGNVWIPTGPNGHGGPHWDVQHPDGSYDNIVPGGKVRGKK